MLSKIESLHTEMRELIVKTPVGIKRYDRLLHALGKRSDAYLVLMYMGMLRIRNSDEYIELYNSYNLPNMTAETWENYKLFGMTGLPEQQRFRAAGVAIAQLFKTFFKELTDARKQKKTFKCVEGECSNT